MPILKEILKGCLYLEKKQEENRREEITSESLNLGFPGDTSGRTDLPVNAGDTRDK